VTASIKDVPDPVCNDNSEALSADPELRDPANVDSLTQGNLWGCGNLAFRGQCRPGFSGVSQRGTEVMAKHCPGMCRNEELLATCVDAARPWCPTLLIR
jgi:hypothetical protein